MATDITSSTSNIMWSPPTNILRPNYYNIQFQCHRLCELVVPVISTIINVSSPYLLDSIAPHSNCMVTLLGFYDNDNFTMANDSFITFSTGIVKFVIHITQFTSLSFFLVQLPINQ